MSVDPTVLPILAGGIAQVLVAALVLGLAPGRLLHRALAALLAARGATNVLLTASSDPAWTLAAIEVQPYFALAVVPLALYAMSLVRRGEDDARARPRGWLTAGAIAALATAYAVDHTLFHTVAPGQAAVGAMQAGPGVQYLAFGPLSVVGAAMPLVLALLGLRLAVDYRRRAEGSAAGPLLLLAAGFLVVALVDAASRLAALSALLDGGAGFDWAPWGWAVAALPPLAAVPALLGTAVLAAGRTVRRPLHDLETAVLIGCGLAFFSGFLRLVVAASSDPGAAGLSAALLGVWRLVAPGCVAAAVLVPAWGAARSRPREALAWVAAASAIALAGALAAGAAQPLGDPAPLLAAVGAAAAATLAARPLARAGRAVAALVLPAPPPSPTARGAHR